MYSLTTLLFFLCGLTIYIYFYRHNLDLILIFYEWRNMKLCFTTPDKRLFRDVYLAVLVVMVSAISENAVYHANIWNTP
ncbi:unnamed protein product, partial [Allacma fusca]